MNSEQTIDKPGGAFINIQHVDEHMEYEKLALDQLLKLENLMRDHQALALSEMVVQKGLLDRLTILSNRYMQIVSTGPCCQYPEIYSGPAEDVVLHEYHIKLCLLRSSNARLMASLDSLRESTNLFDKYCAKLDMKMETPLILGDTFHKPLSYFIEMVADCFKYFHALTLKLSYHAHLLQPSDLQGLEAYKLLLKPSEDFDEYLRMGLTYCKCLRPKPSCARTKSTNEMVLCTAKSCDM